MLLSLVIIALVVVNLNFFTFKYDIVDSFEDNSEDGNFMFMFVAVNEYDTTMIKLLGEKLKRKQLAFKYDGKDDINVLMAHFYIPDDTTAIPDYADSILLAKYPDQPDIKDKLNYIENGIIYVSFSKPVAGYDKQVQMYHSPIFLPKSAYSAEEVLKID